VACWLPEVLAQEKGSRRDSELAALRQKLGRAIDTESLREEMPLAKFLELFAKKAVPVRIDPAALLNRPIMAAMALSRNREFRTECGSYTLRFTLAWRASIMVRSVSELRPDFLL